MKLKTVFLGLVLGVSVATFAQSDMLRIPSMQEVYKHNNWLSGRNPIGLSFNHFNAFSIAEVGYSPSSGNLEKVSLPTSSNVYSVLSESFQKLGKVALYGKLNYEQSQTKGQNWNGMMNDYWQSVSLCDSVSGKRNNEAYHLVGALSLPIRTNWLLGGKFDYRVQMLAKNTDPRNKNQWSEWILTPGIGYQADNYAVGLSLLYANRKETVDYQNMGMHAIYPVFVAYPLSYFKTLSSDGNIKWYYSEQEIGGALQAEFSFGKLRFFQQLEGSITKQNIESNRIQDRKEGEANLWQVNYLGKLKRRFINIQHEWEVKIKYQQTNNYDPLQQQEENGVWKSYGKVLRSTQRKGICELSYEYRKLRDSWHPRFSLNSGVRYQYQENALLFYPIKYSQPLHRLAISTVYFYNFVLPNAYLDCSLGGVCGVGKGTMMKKEASLSTQSGEDIKLSQNTSLLQQDYDFKTAARLNMNFSVTYTHRVPFSWYIRLAGSYEYLYKCQLNENSKKIVTYIGLKF